jgi:hypothetical protein
MMQTVSRSFVIVALLVAGNSSSSAEFYRSISGWNIRQRGDGHTGSHDATGGK